MEAHDRNHAPLAASENQNEGGTPERWIEMAISAEAGYQGSAEEWKCKYLLTSVPPKIIYCGSRSQEHWSENTSVMDIENLEAK